MNELSEQLSGVFSLLLDVFVFSVSKTMTVTDTLHVTHLRILYGIVLWDIVLHCDILHHIAGESAGDCCEEDSDTRWG